MEQHLHPADAGPGVDDVERDDDRAGGVDVPGNLMFQQSIHGNDMMTDFDFQSRVDIHAILYFGNISMKMT